MLLQLNKSEEEDGPGSEDPTLQESGAQSKRWQPLQDSLSPGTRLSSPYQRPTEQDHPHTQESLASAVNGQGPQLSTIPLKGDCLQESLIRKVARYSYTEGKPLKNPVSRPVQITLNIGVRLVIYCFKNLTTQLSSRFRLISRSKFKDFERNRKKNSCYFPITNPIKRPCEEIPTMATTLFCLY